MMQPLIPLKFRRPRASFAKARPFFAAVFAGTCLLNSLTSQAHAQLLDGKPPGFPQRNAKLALPQGFFPVTGETYVEPEQRAGFGGLTTSMTASIAPAEDYGGVARNGFLNYDGGIPGPTFVLRPGTRFNLNFTNQISEITNLHFHGLHVSPSGVSDNVFLKPKPGETVNYKLDIPWNHPGGMYWYHPHMHELAQEQLDRGLAGAIIIEAGHKLNPVFQAMRQRVMLLQWVQYDPTTGDVNPDGLIAGTVPYFTMLNGVKNPMMKMHPGESQYWHIGNVTGTVWYNLRLDGCDIWVIAEDGNPLEQPRKVEQLELSPAKRFEIVVTAKKAGTFELKTLGKNVDGVFSWQPETLATLVVEGSTVPTLNPPLYVSRNEDLRKATVAHVRTVVFTQHLPSDDLMIPTDGGGGTPPAGGFPPLGGFTINRADFKFFVDGLLYDENVVNTTVGVNTVEEWTIINDSGDAHAFHIHVNPFQVIAVDGTPLDKPYWADTGIINGHPGTPTPHSITFRTKFADYAGRYVYHCHNLFHEDLGMMAVIDVVKNPAKTPAKTSAAKTGGASKDGLGLEF